MANCSIIEMPVFFISICSSIENCGGTVAAHAAFSKIHIICTGCILKDHCIMPSFHRAEPPYPKLDFLFQ